MSKINVFDTCEQTIPILNDFLESNNSVREKMYQIGMEKEAEYSVNIGYRDKLKIDLDDLTNINSNLVGLPVEESREIWKNVGKGLELTCAICLSSYDGTYDFSADIVRPDCLTPRGNKYVSIRELVDGLKQCLEEESEDFQGAGIKPFVYTINEEIKLSDEQKDDFVKNIDELGSSECFVENINELEDYALEISELKKELQNELPEFLALGDVPIRGLNQKERKEFEELFY